MNGGLKQVTVKPGHEAAFEQLFKKLRTEMRQHEPDCILYSLLRSRTDPRKYIVHEQYRNQKALEIHEESSHGAMYFSRMREVIEDLEVEYFDGIVE